MMRAILCNTTGDSSVLTITHVPIPTPDSTQILVHVKTTALNRADILQRLGKYPPPPGESNILGLEIAGEVVQVGAAVSHIHSGDRVCGLVGSGGYAEYCLLDAQCAIPIPSHMSYIEAAAIPEAFLTANAALFTLGNLQPNESVLIHAGGSGVGTAAIQLAKQIGATVFTTVSSAEKASKVSTLGADHLINYKETDFAAVIQSYHGVDVIVDFVGASYFAKHINILNIAGRLICVGLMGGTKTEIDLNTLIRKRLQIKGLIMRARPIEDKRKITQYFIETQLPLFIANKIHPVIDTVYPWQDVQIAHQRMENNSHVGKIILELS